MASGGQINTKNKRGLLSLKSQRIPTMRSESIFSKGVTMSLIQFFQNNATPPCAALPDKIDGLSSAVTAVLL